MCRRGRLGEEWGAPSCPCGRPARARPGVIPSTAAGRRPSAVPGPVPPPAAARPKPRREDPHCAQARQPLPPRLANRARAVGGHDPVCGLSLAGVVSRSAGCLALSLRRVLRCADFAGLQSPWLRFAAVALALWLWRGSGLTRKPYCIWGLFSSVVNEVVWFPHGRVLPPLGRSADQSRGLVSGMSVQVASARARAVPRGFSYLSSEGSSNVRSRHLRACLFQGRSGCSQTSVLCASTHILEVLVL